MTREATSWILENVDDGALNAREVLLAALNYLSEDDVRDMCHANEIGWPGNDNYSGNDDSDDDSDDDSEE